MSTIASKLSEIRRQIAAYEKKYARAPESVHLLAVSKTRSVAEISFAIAAGQRRFGENYVQEALPKISALSDQDIEWHFIGPIQSNKTRKIAEHFNWVHSVASMKIAKRLNEQRPPHLEPLQVCIEVNLQQEESKFGINPTEIITLAKYINTLPHLKLRGLMSIPAATTDFAAQRRAFQALHSLFEQLQSAGFNVDTLSMGMSGDFEAAIAEGSTLIRLGTALFGPRS
jgi:pyridoxal phosphate enzyme (YggS family)